MRPNIFNILYKALNSDHTELQQTAFECMKKVGFFFLYYSFSQSKSTVAYIANVCLSVCIVVKAFSVVC